VMSTSNHPGHKSLWGQTTMGTSCRQASRSRSLQALVQRALHWQLWPPRVRAESS